MVLENSKKNPLHWKRETWGFAVRCDVAALTVKGSPLKLRVIVETLASYHMLLLKSAPHPGFFFFSSIVNACTPASCCQATKEPTELGVSACCNIKMKRAETRLQASVKVTQANLLVRWMFAEGKKIYIHTVYVWIHMVAGSCNSKRKPEARRQIKICREVGATSGLCGHLKCI